MIDSFRKIMGSLSITETDQEIIISGFDGAAFIRDINKYWRTTKLATQLFNTVSRRSISFYKFFAPEIYYMLEAVKNYRSRYISIKTVNAIREAMLQYTWLKNTRPVDTNSVPGRLNFKMLDKLTFTPDGSQKAYFENYNYRIDQYGLRGDIVAGKPGTGKTFMTMAIAEMVESDIIIVVCEKKSIDLIWKPSIIEMYKERQKVWSTIDDKAYNGQRILISHYQAQDKIIDLLRSGIFKGKNITVILDESHNMNDPNSAQSLKFQQICFMSNSNNRLLASGTPVKALGSELVSALRVLDDLFTNEVEERFKKAFGKETQKGLDIVQHRFGLIAYVIEKKDTEVLPPRIKAYRIKIPNGSQYTLNAIKRDCEAFIRERVKFYAARRPEDEKYWAKLMAIHENSLKTQAQKDGFARYKNLIKIIQKNQDPRYIGEEIKESNQYEKMFIEPTLPRNEIAAFRDIKSVIKYVMLKIQGECLGRVLGAKRIQCHVDMVPYIDWVGITESTMKKTIAFTSFVEVVDTVDKYTNKLGMHPAVVYGKTNDNLPQIISRFEKDPKLNPLVATYASLSTAVRMTMADTMVTINSPFRHYILEQAIARIYRKGQDSQTVVYQCTLDTEDEPNISTRSDDILKWSQAMVEAIMGIKSPFEITESLESYVDKNNNFDENKIIYQMLKESFEKYDIAIDFNDFDTRMYKPYQPAYMRF
ncbi:hypothetical protein RVBP18_0640 [Pseudomonas phage sp. LC]|nr:hypothetical protein RVBP18_0640 [Pseudomonas phage sp. LC]